MFISYEVLYCHELFLAIVDILPLVQNVHSTSASLTYSINTIVVVATNGNNNNNVMIFLRSTSSTSTLSINTIVVVATDRRLIK
jgi:hypothetical protein